MSELAAKTVCILGRQPALGLAELERLYGAEHLRPIDGAALLDIPAEEVNFQKLGGTIKVARILTVLEETGWPGLAGYLTEKIPEHLKNLPDGKFTLGLSAYGIKVSPKEIGRTGLEIKKAIKQSGRPIRIVPNKTAVLNSAQVLHNKLTRRGAWELILVRDGKRTILAQTLFVQDIEAYGARDQARPFRDAKVGMLPPKLAQILINLAVGTPHPEKSGRWDKDDGLSMYLIADPFCGTGVVLQEALLMGYSVYGTDKDPRMAEYTRKNLQWLIAKYPIVVGRTVIETADATVYKWPGFSAIVSETYLGRPLNKLPAETALKQIISDTNTVIKKFLENLHPQLIPEKHKVCLAVPAWRRPDGSLIKLPLIDHLTDMGYNYLDLKNVRRDELVYFREDQVVARQLLIIRKK
jgi:tRNA G10  N-methylase Trm11